MKNTKKLLLLVAAAMLLTLMTACAGSGDNGSGSAEDYHYEPADIELPPELEDYSSGVYSDGKLYLTAMGGDREAAIYVLDIETGEYGQISLDGGSSFINALYPDGNGGVYFVQASPSGMGGPDGYGTYSEGFDGDESAEQAGGPEPEGDPEIEGGSEQDSGSQLDEMPELDGEPGINEQSGTSAENFFGGSSGAKLYHLGSDGTIVAETELGEYAQNDFITSMITDGEGKIYLAGMQTLAVFDDELNFIQNITLEDGRRDGISDIALSSEGEIIVSMYGSGKLYGVDVEAGKLDEKCTTNSSGGAMLSNGGEADLYYHDAKGIWSVDLSSGECVQLLQWLDCDIVGSGVSAVYSSGVDFIVSSGGGMNVTVQSGPESEGRASSPVATERGFVKLLRTEGPASESKTVLELATLQLSSELQTAITGFNKTNGNYRINVTDYSQYNTVDDSDAGMTKLNTEIIAGDVPDIIDLTGLSAEKYISLGLLTDLYELMDSDSEMSRDDFLANILRALETDGKLYKIVPIYGISTAIGRASDIGSDMGWTLSEYEALMAAEEEGVSSFANMTSSDYLSKMLKVSASRYIDWETGTCSFDSETFIELLEAAGKYPQEVDRTDANYVDSLVQMYNGTAILEAAELYSESISQMYEALLGGEITYKGYPTSDGEGGNSILPKSTLGISSSTEHRDGAWEFLKYVLSEELQSSEYEGFPLRSTSLYTKLSSFLSGDDAAAISIMTDSGPITAELTALSEEAIAKLTELIESTDTVSLTDDTLSNIVLEEAASYFSGSKTVGEIAEIIQNRVATYISEQS